MHSSIEPKGEITRALTAWQAGNQEALSTLFPRVFEDARALAREIFRGESPGHTLEPTALVHEIYLKLAQAQSLRFENRRSLFRLLATMMRHHLINHAKQRCTEKRWGQLNRQPLNAAHAMPIEQRTEIVELRDALADLRTSFPRQAEVVELRYFAGLTFDDIASVLGRARSTVCNDWRRAKIWLLDELGARCRECNDENGLGA